jgi:hypothetical protein
MPGARCTRSPCAEGRKHTVVTTGSPEHPAFPAQWFYDLYRALPGDEFVLSPSLTNERFIGARLGFANLRQLDTSNGCQDHTALPSASAPFVYALVDRSRVPRDRPASSQRDDAIRVHRIPSQRS